MGKLMIGKVLLVARPASAVLLLSGKWEIIT
jgi:hypothetical protein